MIYRPKKLFIENEVTESPLVERILAGLPDIPTVAQLASQPRFQRILESK